MRSGTDSSRRAPGAILRRGLRAPWRLALALVLTLSASAAAQEGRSTEAPEAQSTDGASARAAGTGQLVAELDPAILFVFQSRNGDRWFGSDERGVYRHDGKSLVNFTVADGLASNTVRGLQEDEAGSVYVTTYSGISKFDGQTFSRLRVSATSAETDWKLRPGDLWFTAGQDTGAVYRYDGELLHRLTFPPTPEGEDLRARWSRDKHPNAKFSPYDVYVVFEDSKGSLWFGTNLLGACRYDGTSFAWLSDTELGNGSFGTRSIVEDREGLFWFGDPAHRYAVDLSGATPSFRREDGLRETPEPRKPFHDRIISGALDRAGALWIATYGEGVWRLDGKTAVHYPVLDEEQGLTVFTIHEDNQGVMWLGTHKAGPYRFNGESFEKFKP
jgi:ligand-binding sensor domain-containing protein